MAITLRTRRTRGRSRGKPPDQREAAGLVADASTVASAASLTIAHGDPPTCVKEMEALIEKYFGDFQFLLDEFSKLEILASEAAAADVDPAADTDSKLGKLRSFTSHVRRTMARMRAARSGRDPLSVPQVNLLEEHIATAIMPVKSRLERQLSRGSLAFALLADNVASNAAGGDSGGSGSHCGVIAGDGSSLSSSLSRSIGSSSGSLSQNDTLQSDDGEPEPPATSFKEVRGGSRAVGMELTDDFLGVALGSPPSSGYGRDGGGVDDRCGAAVTPSIGGRQDSPAPSPRCWSGEGGVAGRLAQHRRDQLDLLSQLEAEGVFAADDSYTPCRVDLGGDMLPLVVPVGMFGNDEPKLCSEFSRVRALVNFGEEVEDRGGVRASRGPNKSGKCRAAYENPRTSTAGKKELSAASAAASAAEPAAGSTSALTVSAFRLSPFMGPMEGAAPATLGAVSGTLEADMPRFGGEAEAPTSKITDGTARRPRDKPTPPPAEAAISCCSHIASHQAEGGAEAQEEAGAGASGSTSPTARVFEASPDSVGPEQRFPVGEPTGLGTPTAPVSGADDAARPGTAATAGVSSAREHASASASPAEVVSGADAIRVADACPEACAAPATGATAHCDIASGALALGVSAKPPGADGRRGGMLVLAPRPAKRRRSSAFPAALLQPREVRYECVACRESYTATVAGNPWWLLVRQECPACGKVQIPRVDIRNPTNNVEGHIAFLTEACAENGSDADGNDYDGVTSDDNSDGEDSGDEGSLGGNAAGNGDGAGGGGRGAGGRASLDSEQAAKLLVLMCHARSCPGNHRSPRLAEVCRSVKFLMLHLRDCDGRTRSGQPCPLPWCQPCTALLHHLIQCPESTTCQVCNPSVLPAQLRELRALNDSGAAQDTQLEGGGGAHGDEHASPPIPFALPAPDPAATH